MATSSIPLFNTDPNVQAQAGILQQRMALAQALQAQGMQPVDTSNRSIGGIAYRVSPLEGLAKMLQAYGGQKMMQDTMGQQAQLASQAYASALQANQPGEGPSYSDQQVTGANQGAIPQTPGGGPPAPRDVASALMQQGPANQGSVNPRNPLGMPAELLTAYQAGMIPKEVFDAQAALYKPTEATLTARQGGLDPMAANRTKFQQGVTDPKIWAMQQAGFTPEQIYAAQYGETAKASDVERRPGQSFSNAFTGAAGITPHIPENANPVGVPGPNGAIPGVTPIPGAAPVVQGNSQATSTGAANGSIVFPTTTSGAVVPMRGAQAAPTGPAGMAGAVAGPTGATLAQVDNEIAQTQRGISTVQDPTSKAMLQQHLADMQQQRQSMLASQPPALGQSTADKIGQEANAKTMSDYPTQIVRSKQAVTGLENALAAIENVKATGPGTAKTSEVLALIQNAGIPISEKGVANYQLLKKYLANSLTQATQGTTSGDSDKRLDQAMEGNPNSETMNIPALKSAIRYVASQHDAAIARAEFVQQKVQANPQDPNAAQKAQQEWSTKVYNPRVFEFSRLSPKEQQEAAASMKQKGELAGFQEQYNFAHEHGWVK